MITPGDVTVVGLGYVGLPLALAFADQFSTIGYDNDFSRVEELNTGRDRNLEIENSLIGSSGLTFTSDQSCVTNADFIVVTVPTPVTSDNRPDLSLLESASMMIGRCLRDRSDDKAPPIIVFESTTYPGCTEEYCGPIIARESGMESGIDFLLGYSPERTNFGDGEHTLETVVKVVSGQTFEAAKVVGEMYSRIAKAGIHMAPDIKTAEASKVIENVQRDLNIALFNESAMIFDRMGIESSAVFDAAATKWNFHRYQPGLVGGHCIPVDPYYLTYAAEKAGYTADVILAGRSVNEGMTGHVTDKIIDLVSDSGRKPDRSRVLILGQTFKSDVADFRNSKAVELAERLRGLFKSTTAYDPYNALNREVRNPTTDSTKYDAVVLAVGHAEFFESPSAVVGLVEPGGVLVDLTGGFDYTAIEDADLHYWQI